MTLGAIFNGVYYLQVGAWQILVVAVVMVLAVACLLPVAVLARGGQPSLALHGAARWEAAGTWLVTVIMVVFCLTELFEKGVTPIAGPVGALLILVVGLLVVPRRRALVLLLVVAYGAYVGLVNWLEPWLPFARYDMRQLSVYSSALAVFLVFCLVMAILASIARAYRRITTIRLRLPVSFALVVLLTVALLGAAVLLVASRNGRQQVVRQLEAVSRIKEAEIERWVSAVQADLDLVVDDVRVLPRLLLMLQDPGLADAQELFVWNSMSQVVKRSELLDSLLVLDNAGKVVVATDTSQKGQDRSAEIYFEKGLSGFYLQPPVYDAASEAVVLVVARPLVDGLGNVAGVVAADVSLPPLAEILGRQAWMGDTGEVYLVDRNRVLLTRLRFGDRGHVSMDTGAAVPPPQAGAQARSAAYRDYRGQAVIAYMDWLPQLDVGLVAKQDQSEALTVTYSLMVTVAVAALGVLVLAVGVSLALTQSITRPLAHLTERSAQIAAGDLSLTAEIEQRDEIGTLARVLNTMTAQVRSLIAGLEERVAERTRELERRSAYLQASADVGRAVSSILDPERLGQEVVHLIAHYFDMEAVGLFLLDETGERAVLHASTGSSGDVSWAGGSRVRPGEGLVGRSILAAQQQSGGRGLPSAVSGRLPETNPWDRQHPAGTEPASPRAVSGASPRAAHLRLRALRVPGGPPGSGTVQVSGEIDELQTRAALPLRSRGEVMGAIAVLHKATQAGALDRDTLLVLQTMADQVAVALDNARLFVASRRAFEAERRAYGQVSQQAWAQMVRSQPVRGYRSDDRGVLALTGGPPPRRQDRAPGAERSGEAPAAQRSGEAPAAERSGEDVDLVNEADGQTAVVPIRVRDKTIGLLHFRKEGAGQNWTRDEVALLQSMADQLGQALEGARLYHDVQHSAARDRVLAGVTGRMRESLEVDAVLQAAVQEMRSALGLAAVEVRLAGGPIGDPSNHQSSGNGIDTSAVPTAPGERRGGKAGDGDNSIARS